jgi:hypothetical protein
MASVVELDARALAVGALLIVVVVALTVSVGSRGSHLRTKW